MDLNQLKVGALLSYLSIIITLIIALLYTPVMIRLLGKSEYGLYSLIGSIAAYFSIMDLGLGNAIVRYTARNRASGDKQFESKLNGMFIVLYSLIGFLTIIIGMLVYYNIESIFGAKLSTIELRKAKVMVIILIINFALSFPLSVFGSFIRAYERFIVDKLVSITRIIMVPALTLPILFMGYGSVSIVVVTTVVNISCLLFSAVYAFKKLDIKFHIGKIDIDILKEILGYSFFIFLNIIVDQIFWKTDQVILGIVSGTLSVAVYAIGMHFITMYMKFSTAISNLFLPKISMMEANNAGSDDFTKVMVKYGRIQYILIAYILSGFIIFGHPFITVWAGTGYQQAYYIVLIVMIPLTVPLVQNLGIAILQAKNRLAFRSTLYIILAIINVIISIPLATHHDGIGAAIATSLSLICGHIVIMNVYYYKKIGIDIPYFWRNIAKISFPVILSIIIGLSITFLISVDKVLYFVIEIILFSIIYFSLTWKLAMNSYEKNTLSSIIKKFMNKFKLLIEKVI